MESDDLISDLMDGLRSQLPGADDGIILYAMRDTVRELCRRGRVWTVERDMPALRNIGALKLSTAVGFGEPVFIEDVSFKGVRLRYREIDYGTEKAKSGKPTEWSFLPPDRVLVQPVLENPEPGDSFHVQIVVQPRLGEDAAKTLSHVPGYVYSQYAQMITEGTLARMFAMPGKPWSNGVLAPFYGRTARAKMAGAIINTRNAMGANHIPRWVFPRPAGRTRL